MKTSHRLRKYFLLFSFFLFLYLSILVCFSFIFSRLYCSDSKTGQIMFVQKISIKMPLMVNKTEIHFLIELFSRFVYCRKWMESTYTDDSIENDWKSWFINSQSNWKKSIFFESAIVFIRLMVFARLEKVEIGAGRLKEIQVKRLDVYQTSRIDFCLLHRPALFEIVVSIESLIFRPSDVYFTDDYKY